MHGKARRPPALPQRPRLPGSLTPPATSVRSQGTLIYPNGERYEGSWVYGKRHGFGIFTCAADGYRYEGEWYQGRRHGTGTIYLPNGDAFSGSFKEGRSAGPVEYRFADDSPWANPDL